MSRRSQSGRHTKHAPPKYETETLCWEQLKGFVLAYLLLIYLFTIPQSVTFSSLSQSTLPYCFLLSPDISTLDLIPSLPLALSIFLSLIINA